VRISQKVEYAVRAMIDLAAQGTEHTVRSGSIARRAGVPEKYLEAILVELGRAGLVSSRRGPEGGHRLARSPSTIRLLDIYAAVEGPLALAPPRARRAGPPGLDRVVGDIWRDIEQAVGTVLDATTLDELAKRAQAGREILDFNI
jgi:Rrf2 family protein